MSSSDSSSSSPRRRRHSSRPIHLAAPARIEFVQRAGGIYALAAPVELRLLGYRGSSRRLSVLAMPICKTKRMADSSLQLRNVAFVCTRGSDPEQATRLLQEHGAAKYSPKRLSRFASIRFTELILEIEANELSKSKKFPKLAIVLEIFHEEYGSLGTIAVPAVLASPSEETFNLPEDVLLAITKLLCPHDALSFAATSSTMHKSFEKCDEYWHFIYCKHFLIPLKFSEVAPHATWREKYQEKQSPHKLVHYSILENIGDGTTSEVIRVLKKSNEAVLVLKQIPKIAITSRRIPWEHVQNEKEALRRCHHRNIVRCYATFQDTENLNFVLENADTSLHDLARRYRGLDLPCVKFFAADILSALECLHTQAYIIHRDVKPENMLICNDGRLVLCDFGTCVLCDETTPKSPQPMDMLTGTPEFMAPEIRELTVCYASDLWAFGISLYQLALWKLPFRGETEFAILKLVSEFHDGNLQYPHGFPMELRSLINHLVRRHPEKRLGFESYQDLKNHAFFGDLDWGSFASLPRPEWRGSEWSLETVW